MGKLFAAMFSLLVAVLLGGLGAGLSLWVAAGAYRSEWALRPALWAIEHAPLPLYASATRVASDLVQRDGLIAAGVLAAVLCVLALSSLRSARLALRSDDHSHDGRATIELKPGPLRVGRPIEGSIWLEQAPERGERYRVELSCSRGRGSDDTAYCEELVVAPVATPVGWNLPFRFSVPLIAPASGTSRFTSGPGYRWRLAVQRASGRSVPSFFTLDLAPAPADELRSLEKREPELREPVLRQPAARAPGAPPAAYGRPEESAPLPASSVYETVREETRPQAAGNASARSHGRESPPLREPMARQETRPQAARSEDAQPRRWQPPLDEQRAREAARPREETDGRAPRPAWEPPLHERPEFRDPFPADDAPAPSGASLPVRIAKWLFLALFGGALAVAGVALVTAVLIGYLF